MGMSTFPTQPSRTTKVGSFSTTSTTYVTALSVTGPGRILQLSANFPTVSGNLRVTIDGTVIATVSAANQGGNLDISGGTGGPFLANSSYGSLTLLPFAQSLLVEVSISSASYTAQVNWAYEQ